MPERRSATTTHSKASPSEIETARRNWNHRIFVSTMFNNADRVPGCGEQSYVRQMGDARGCVQQSAHNPRYVKLGISETQPPAQPAPRFLDGPAWTVWTEPVSLPGAAPSWGLLLPPSRLAASDRFRPRAYGDTSIAMVTCTSERSDGDHLRELTAKEDLEWLGGFDDL